jgi:short-subunit dehydrogenase
MTVIENVAISCDTESTEERKFSDLETEVECDHVWVNKAGAGYRENPVEVCVKCEEEL